MGERRGSERHILQESVEDVKKQGKMETLTKRSTRAEAIDKGKEE